MRKTGKRKNELLEKRISHSRLHMFPFPSTDPFISWPTNEAQATIGNCLQFKMIFILSKRFKGNIFWKVLLSEVETMQSPSQSERPQSSRRVPCKKERGALRKYRKEPISGPKILFCGCGSKLFHPIFFRLNTLRSVTEAPTVDVLRLDILRDTKTTSFLFARSPQQQQFIGIPIYR